MHLPLPSFAPEPRSTNAPSEEPVQLEHTWLTPEKRWWCLWADEKQYLLLCSLSGINVKVFFVWCTASSGSVGFPSSIPSQNRTFDVTKFIALVPEFWEVEVDCYFAAFERIAQALQWPPDVWSLLFLMQLKSFLLSAREPLKAYVCVCVCCARSSISFRKFTLSGEMERRKESVSEWERRMARKRCSELSSFSLKEDPLQDAPQATSN